MKAKLFFILFFSFLTPLISFGEAPKVIFEENKNQLPEQVKFKADIPGGNLFLEKNTFTYLYEENINWHRDHRNETGDTFTVHYHCYKVNFENSNPEVEVAGNKLFSWHRNYYLGNDPKKWADNVKLYGEVNYKDLYSHIDMQVYNVEKNLKYDFIIHPGGNPKDIRMNYKGTNEMRLESGHLLIKTSVYTLIEEKPYSYQVINGVKTEIPCTYILKNNVVSFSVEGKYDKNLPLIIDPTLIAATYTGSSVDNWGFTSTYDNAGNIYLGGIASGAGYPTTVGASQTTFGGGMAIGPSSWPFDISLTKFNSTGSAILFSTYYGGSSNEQPHSLMVNSNNELYVVGRTNSANFPTTIAAYGPGGGYDIIVGKFNSTGGLLASTRVGGTGDDCVNISANWATYNSLKYNYTDDGRSEIILDNNSNVYVAACTRSNNFPTSAGAYKTTISGSQDACVFKLNSALTALTFSTYLGGTLDDAAYGLKLDNNNNVYVTGGTTSVNFPTTAGVLHTTFQGGVSDAFISVFNPTGTSLLRSTYLGTNAYDQAFMIEIDASGDLYVFGQTKGAYPVTPGTYNNPNSGQFIHKISGLLNSTIFSTVVGKGGFIPNISPTAFLVDSCQSIYIAGWGRSCALDNTADCSNTACTGLPITPNALQSTTDGGDFYFMVFTPNAKSLWYATFYGENYIDPPDPSATPPYPGGPLDHVDGGTSRFDSRAFIYEACCASCGGTGGFPTSPTAYSPTNNGQLPPSFCAYYFVAWPCGKNCNEAAVKMDVHVQPLAVVAATSPTSGCAPLTVSFNNNGSSATDFIYDFGDGSPIDTIASPSHTYSFVGTYTLTLYAIDSLGLCGYIDTAVVLIHVGASPTLATASTNILCNGGVGTATVSPSGGMNPLTYNWNTNPSQTTATATGLNPGTYTVIVSDALGCSSTATVNITQPTALTLSTSTTGASCGIANGTASATAGGGSPGYSYSWSTTPVQTTTTATGLLAGNYTITITDAKGCTKTSPVTIATTNGPSATASIVNNVSCNGSSTGSASATQTGGTAPYTYLWNSSPAQTTQVATGLSAGTYTVIVTDVNGCSAPATITISQPTALSSSITSVSAKCNGGSNGSATASASGGTPGYTYTWGTSPVQTTTTATGLSAGSYNVLITDSKGCTSTQSTNVSQPAPIVLNTSSSGSSCGSVATGVASVGITGGTSPYNYLWSNNQTTQTITGLNSGTYTITGTDANGCTAQSTATIPIAVQPNAVFTDVQNISCEGISVQFSNTSSQATGYFWDFGDGNTSTQQNPIHTFPSSGTFVITLVAENPPCKDTVSNAVMIGDINPLHLGAANVFTPNGDGKNDCFTLAPDTAYSIKNCLYLEIFDRWGVKMFESLGSDNCWDGKNKNDNKQAAEGTYYYIAKLGATAIKGYITLIR